MKLLQAFNFFFGSFFNRAGVRINHSLLYLQRKRTIDRNYMDYIRLSALELVADEINTKGVKGSTAELGVYKGKFARYINLYFPGRKLFLFDTFEGFNQADVTIEREKSFSSGNQDFSNTSVAGVLKRMPDPSQCVIRKGYFPETAAGIEETFAFVSIDADLYEPILSGLNFFYPRLSKGGFIFVHDYNNDAYKGAKRAVEEFCRTNDVSCIPLPDAAGTALIVK